MNTIRSRFLPHSHLHTRHMLAAPRAGVMLFFFLMEYMWALRTCGQVCVNISSPTSALMAGRWIIAMAMVNGARMVMFAGELFQEKQGDWRLFTVLPPFPLAPEKWAVWCDPGGGPCPLQGTWAGQCLAPNGRNVDRADPRQEWLLCRFKSLSCTSGRTGPLKFYHNLSDLI